eukprot:COSAG02_NODE_1376_length_12993_cov_56.849542_3_plen_208_part_00
MQRSRTVTCRAAGRVPPREAELRRELPDDGSGGPNPHGFVLMCGFGSKPRTTDLQGRQHPHRRQRGKVRGVEEQVVVTPEHIKAFVRLQSAWSEEGSRWSDLRLARAKAMVCLGFMAYLRKSEVGALDRCDVWREMECTKVRVCKAKNDPVGRGRVTIVGAACGDSREVESTIWRWIELAGLSVSSQCSKSLDPRGRCAACGPLFPC